MKKKAMQLIFNHSFIYCGKLTVFAFLLFEIYLVMIISMERNFGEFADVLFLVFLSSVKFFAFKKSFLNFREFLSEKFIWATFSIAAILLFSFTFTASLLSFFFLGNVKLETTLVIAVVSFLALSSLYFNGQYIKALYTLIFIVLSPIANLFVFNSLVLSSSWAPCIPDNQYSEKTIFDVFLSEKERDIYDFYFTVSFVSGFPPIGYVYTNNLSFYGVENQESVTLHIYHALSFRDFINDKNKLGGLDSPYKWFVSNDIVVLSKAEWVEISKHLQNARESFEYIEKQNDINKTPTRGVITIAFGSWHERKYAKYFFGKPQELKKPNQLQGVFDLLSILVSKSCFWINDVKPSSFSGINAI